MEPAHIVKADRLADLVCHDEQMTIWSDEVRQQLMEHLREPVDYGDAIALDFAVKQAIRHIVERAFAHPEIMGLGR